MGDMIRCPKCATHHYRNDPCPDEEPRKNDVHNQSFEDYCEAVRVLTRFATAERGRATLAQRAKAAIDEIDRLQEKLEGERL